MKQKISAKDVQLPHSKAKVEFYVEYLKRYLRILMNAEFCKQINVFDVFCGRGIYDDGNKGSAIQSFEVICEQMESKKASSTNITLYLNDVNKKHIKNIERIIGEKDKPKMFSLKSTSMDAEEYLINNLPVVLNKTQTSARNLVFIDPYGYKHIRKENLFGLMENRKTEIILFLPISMIQRFASSAISEPEIAEYRPLAEFIESFFDDKHPVKRGQKISEQEYIRHITDVLKNDGKYYAASYYLERGAKKGGAHYFALFFMSSNTKGFEKILEVKWALDDANGKGFNKPNPQMDLFEEMDREECKQNHFLHLEGILKDALAGLKTNREIYDITLRSEYLPKHANDVLRKFQKDGNLDVVIISDNSPADKNSFYLREKKDKVRLIYKEDRNE